MISKEDIQGVCKVMKGLSNEKILEFWMLLDGMLKCEMIGILMREGGNVELLKLLNHPLEEPSYLYQAIRSGDMNTLVYCNENYIGERYSWLKDAIYKSLIKYEKVEGGQKYLMDLLLYWPKK